MRPVFHIHPISKFHHASFREERSQQDYGRSIDLSARFWSEVFREDHLRAQYDQAIMSLDHQRDREQMRQNFSYCLDSLPRVRELFGTFSDRTPGADEVIYGYRILQELLGYYHLNISDWGIDLAGGITYQANNFSSDNPDISQIDAIIAEKDKHFPYRHIQSILDEIKIRDAIVVIDFFWPGELLQTLMICDILRSHGNTIIIDATHGNEQFDFSQWISVFREEPRIFQWFDHFIVYQDYGQTLGALLSTLQMGSEEGLPNIISQDPTHGVVFTPPTRNPDPETLFSRFTQYFLDKKHISHIGGDRLINLRLLPYKCYWSACNFCAINSTNLYAFRLTETDTIHRYVDACIDFLDRERIGQVIFIDEAIHPRVIEYFAREILRRGVSLISQFRTRFELDWTPELCDLLARSGVRYCGIGLETAIDRLEATVNKGLSHIPTTKKQEIIENFDRAGIALHNYAIFGFPSETRAESLDNARFLMKNIQSLNHYTCTPNILSLMRGTTYFAQAHLWGIEIDTMSASRFSLNYSFSTQGVQREIPLYQKLARAVHHLQFASWVREEQMDPTHFWTFIDRTALFYLMKRKYRENPYHEYWQRNTALGDPLQIFFRRSLGIQWLTPLHDLGPLTLYDWISDRSLNPPPAIRVFLEGYDEQKSLGENLQLSTHARLLTLWIPILIDSRILVRQSV